MMMEKKNKKIDIKKILIFVAPLILVLSIVLYLKASEKDSENSQENTMLIPDSEENVIYGDKVEAYKHEKEVNQQKDREKQESILRNSDFFREVAGDVDEPIIQSEEDVVDFYEQTVVNKVNRTSNNQGNYQSKQTYRTEQPKSIDPIFDEEVEELTLPTQASALSEKKNNNSLQNRLNSYGKKNTDPPKQEYQTMDEAEADPKNYNRRRRRNANSATTQNFIKACIHDDQVATDGSSVTMRTLEECKVSGVVIPRNTIFSGTARISEERTEIQVKNLKYGGQMLAVEFTIYDNDAIRGLNLPDNIKKELAKKTKDAAIDQVKVNTGQDIISSSVQSLSNVVKTVAKKDNAQVKVPLKANYQIFIVQKEK